MTETLRSIKADAYISERINQYQSWYDAKAIASKSKYLNMRAGAVVGAAIVPVVVNLGFPYVSYVATIISLLVVILVSLESVYHFGDQWKNYRSTEQFLSREKILFLTGEGPYRGLAEADAFLVLVERCEAQIAAENSATLNVMAVAAQQRETGGSGRRTESSH
jgi:hypothetical protein